VLLGDGGKDWIGVEKSAHHQQSQTEIGDGISSVEVACLGFRAIPQAKSFPTAIQTRPGGVPGGVATSFEGVCVGTEKCCCEIGNPLTDLVEA